MRRIRTGSMVAALYVSAAFLGATARADTVSGPVTAISPAAITVAGATYQIEQSTSIEDRSGTRVAIHEIKPGTPVELDLDDEGHLTTVRATLVR